MLFYLDPPYYGSEGDYGRTAFRREEFSEMADRLEALKGSWLLSINDRPEVREIFDRFAVEAVATTYTVGRGDATKAGELIITRRGLEEPLKAA